MLLTYITFFSSTFGALLMTIFLITVLHRETSQFGPRGATQGVSPSGLHIFGQDSYLEGGK